MAKVVMKELKEYYEKSKRKWFGICIGAWAILSILLNFFEQLAFASIVNWADKNNYEIIIENIS